MPSPSSNLYQALKQLTIYKAPNVLVIHLKRFSYGGIIGKISKAITFEFKISLHSDGQDKNLYNLIGIVVHHGSSIHSGHYVAFVKVCESITSSLTFWNTS